MTLVFRGVRSETDELDKIWWLIRQALPIPRHCWPFICDNIPADEWRALFNETGPVATGASYDMAQWFGGQPIRSAGITLVGVAAHYRGSGVARDFLTQWLSELHGRGYPIASLYASTQTLYRSIGFEYSGNQVRFEMPIKALKRTSSSLPVHLVEHPTPEPFAELAATRGKRNNGNVVRPQGMWNRIFRHLDHPTYSYLLGDLKNPEGYLCCTQIPRGHAFLLEIRDWLATTPEAYSRIWSFVAEHRSVTESVGWAGPASDPMLLQPPELQLSVQQYSRWLIRILDVTAALSQRGYPGVANMELSFVIHDEMFSHNSGLFRLRISDGKPVVQRLDEDATLGENQIRLDVRSLAPLYTGLLSAHQLAAMGRITGTASGFDAADQCFRNGEPWMPEHF